MGRKVSARSASGFTLVEAMVATFVTAIMILALYASIARGFAIVKISREDLRATQIILQRMEAIRLSAYNQLTDPTSNPTNTTVYFNEKGKATGNGGVAYTVTFNAQRMPAPKPQSLFYTNMLQVTVEASWQSGDVQRRRSMQTYVARDGIQQYVSGAY